MVISIDIEKASDKIQHLFTIKNKQTNKQLSKQGIENNFLKWLRIDPRRNNLIKETG